MATLAKAKAPAKKRPGEKREYVGPFDVVAGRAKQIRIKLDNAVVNTARGAAISRAISLDEYLSRLVKLHQTTMTLARERLPEGGPTLVAHSCHTMLEGLGLAEVAV